MLVVKLTPSFIAEHLLCPEGKTRIEMCCAETPGLYIEVRATSERQRTYYLRDKDVNGKTCHQKVGRMIDLSLADARKQARALRVEITLGADPRGQATAQKGVLTFSEFVE